MEHGPPWFDRGRRRPENRLAHAGQKGDCFSFGVGAYLGICVICEICGSAFDLEKQLAEDERSSGNKVLHLRHLRLPYSFVFLKRLIREFAHPWRR